MTQQDKQLLLKDLCARLPYGVKATILGHQAFFVDCIAVEKNGVDVYLEGLNWPLDKVKPYLRPMSSMTKEEREEVEIFISEERFNDGDGRCTKVVYGGYIEFLAIYDCPGIDAEFCGVYVDWLNKHHFDYRNLIEKGLALEAPEGMYKTE